MWDSGFFLDLFIVNPEMTTSDFKGVTRDLMKNFLSLALLEAVCPQEDQMYVAVAQEATVVLAGR